MLRLGLFTSFLCALALAGCQGADPMAQDSGAVRSFIDAGVDRPADASVALDAASATEDGGTSPQDSGRPASDAGGPPTDAGEVRDGGAGRDAAVSADSGVETDAGTAPDASAPPPDAGSAGPDAGPIGPVDVGSPCMDNSSCVPTAGGSCLTGTLAWWSDAFAGGYCTIAGCSTSAQCPGDAICVEVDQVGTTTCLDGCSADADCRSGYFCHSVGACLPGAPPTTTGSPVGGPCAADADCADAGASCVPEVSSTGPTGFSGGYCTIFSCGASAPCPTGSTCYTVDNNGSTACLADCQTRADCRGSAYACHAPGACLPACTAGGCTGNEVCNTTTGLCEAPDCTVTGCGAGLVCDTTSGQCVVNVGTAPAGPIPTCTNSPAWTCTSNCSPLGLTNPTSGVGYVDFPINGETWQNQWRSYGRRDLRNLLKYAAAEVDCLTAGWTIGNGHEIGFGDISEANGAIPGTATGSPGHPPGTHEDGHDIDMAYYQLTGADNRLRSVCPHTSGGQDQYHCTAPPNNLDVWRSALYLAKLHDHPRLRVIGVDGQIGPLIDSAVTQLCARGWVSNSACTSPKWTYETTDTGRGWFRFHHHHFHVSLTGGVPLWSPPAHQLCLTPSCDGSMHDLAPVPRLPRTWTAAP